VLVRRGGHESLLQELSEREWELRALAKHEMIMGADRIKGYNCRITKSRYAMKMIVT
jgi:hypothetical protein